MTEDLFIVRQALLLAYEAGRWRKGVEKLAIYMTILFPKHTSTS